MDWEQDNVTLEAFLALVDREMQLHPERIRPFTARDVEGLDELLAGVDVDLEEDLGDFMLPDVECE